MVDNLQKCHVYSFKLGLTNGTAVSLIIQVLTLYNDLFMLVYVYQL